VFENSVFENSVLRGIFGAKRDEVIGEWGNLHNEELHDLYCSPMGTLLVAQWLRQCATNRKVAGSNPDGVIGISH
jgi:hypothetical protein